MSTVKNFSRQLFPKWLERRFGRQRRGGDANKEYVWTLSEFVQERRVCGFRIRNRELGACGILWRGSCGYKTVVGVAGFEHHHLVGTCVSIAHTLLITMQDVYHLGAELGQPVKNVRGVPGAPSVTGLMAVVTGLLEKGAKAAAVGLRTVEAVRSVIGSGPRKKLPVTGVVEEDQVQSRKQKAEIRNSKAEGRIQRRGRRCSRQGRKGSPLRRSSAPTYLIASSAAPTGPAGFSFPFNTLPTLLCGSAGRNFTDSGLLYAGRRRWQWVMISLGFTTAPSVTTTNA